MIKTSLNILNGTNFYKSSYSALQHHGEKSEQTATQYVLHQSDKFKITQDWNNNSQNLFKHSKLDKIFQKKF